MSDKVPLKQAAIEGLGKLGLSNQIQIFNEQPYGILASGYKIPLFGLGTWSGGPQAEDRGLTKKAVKEAIKIGYRHIDCAWTYRNEDEVGEALQESFMEDRIKRQDLFVTTKLWVNYSEPDKAKEIFRKQLSDLKLDYIDLYLIHNPYPGKPGPNSTKHEETWRALEELVDEGLIRSVGVSNFSPKKIEHLKQHVTKPISVNQIEVHPLWHNFETADWCWKNGIHVTAYSPLGASSSDSMRQFKMQRALDEPVIKEIAKKHNAEAGQVALRWSLQRGLSIVPKSTNPNRIRDQNIQKISLTSSWNGENANFEALNIQLDEEDIKKIDDISPQVRALRFSAFYKDEGPYKNYEEFWDETDTLPQYLKFTGQNDALRDMYEQNAIKAQ